MKKYIYLSITPEALISSMLTPVEFGEYMATGTKKSNKGEAIFFEVDLDKITSLIDMDYLNTRCVMKANGKPKSSVYLSVYRVLETIPVSALKDLYLTTDNGAVLRLQKTKYDVSLEKKKELHLYQELCPVNPLVASILAPNRFLKTLTDGSLHIKLPKLFFVDLKLGELAKNPLSGSAEHLPYAAVSHLRDCLELLSRDERKKMKTVQRFFKGSLLFRTIETGFYVGDLNEMLYYRYPSMTELEENHNEFFRSI